MFDVQAESTVSETLRRVNAQRPEAGDAAGTKRVDAAETYDGVPLSVAEWIRTYLAGQSLY